MELINLNQNKLAMNLYTRAYYFQVMDSYYNPIIEPEQVEYYDDDDDI